MSYASNSTSNGVEIGNSMDDVANAVKGVVFYSDRIGFGALSIGLI
jgi:hypothetical protein